MLTFERLHEIEELQHICETDGNFELKLNWDMLQQRNGDETNDFFHYENDMLVAFLGLYGFGEKVEICGMVHPDFRRRGIFTALLANAIQVCGQREYKEILLNAPADSLTAKGYLESLPCHYSFTEYQMKWSKVKLTDDGNVRIRPSTSQDDLQAEIQLDVSCFGFTEKEAVDYNERIRRDHEQQFYIIEFSNKTVGKIRLSREDKKSWIYGFAIFPEYQGKGMGKKALKKVILAEHKKGQEIFLEVEATNAHALRLYQSCGFTSFHAQDYYQYAITD